MFVCAKTVAFAGDKLFAAAEEDVVGDTSRDARREWRLGQLSAAEVGILIGVIDPGHGVLGVEKSDVALRFRH